MIAASRWDRHPRGGRSSTVSSLQEAINRGGRLAHRLGDLQRLYALLVEVQNALPYSKRGILLHRRRPRIARSGVEDRLQVPLKLTESPEHVGERSVRVHIEKVVPLHRLAVAEEHGGDLAAGDVANPVGGRVTQRRKAVAGKAG